RRPGPRPGQAAGAARGVLLAPRPRGHRGPHPPVRRLRPAGRGRAMVGGLGPGGRRGARVGAERGLREERGRRDARRLRRPRGRRRAPHDGQGHLPRPAPRGKRRRERVPGRDRGALPQGARRRPSSGRRRAGMIVIYLLMALLGSAATIFALQNRDPVTITFLTWSIEGMPVALVILLSLLLGVVFASLSGLVKVLRMRYRIRQLESQVNQLIAAQPSSTTSSHLPPPSPPTPLS